MLVHQVERSAGPDEAVFVDSRGLYWCLRAVGSMEMRRRIVFAGSQAGEASLLSTAPSMGTEFMFVTTAGDPTLRDIRAEGWKVREAFGERPAFDLGSGDVEIFFVVR
jgi:hypothetical protein